MAGMPTFVGAPGGRPGRRRARAPGCVDSVHRQRAGGDPRRRARQRRHGVPPLDRRLAELAGRRDSGAHRRRLPGGAARARRGAQRGVGDRTDRSLRWHHLRHPRARRAGRLRGAARPAAAASDPRRGAGGASLPRRGLPGAGRVQGAHGGAVPARLRAPSAGRDHDSARIAAGGDRGGRRLRLQLPGPLLAARRGGGLYLGGADRGARPAGPSRGRTGRHSGWGAWRSASL